MSRPNRTAQEAQAQITDMFAQSTAVLAQPSPQTFERFERRGGVSQAALYVLVAAVVSGIIAGLFAPFHDMSMIGQFVSRLVTIPLQFFVFTGLVYYIGNSLFKGTGTYNEVAYTFALFFVPLSILATLVGIIPVLGWIASVVIGLAMIYFGYLAVQSSLNLRDSVSAGVTLVLAWVANFFIALVVGGFIGTLFVVSSAVTGR